MKLVFEHSIKRIGGNLLIQVFQISENQYLRRNTLKIKGHKTTVEMYLTASQFEKFKLSALAYKDLENTN